MRQPILMLVMMLVASTGCAHAQQPEQKIYIISEDASGVGSALESGTGGAGAEAYCNELQKQCYKVCWRRKPEVTSIPKGSGMHREYCTEKCRKEFMACVKQQEELERQESRKQEFRFPNMDAALDWLKQHKTEVAIGVVVIVGGVAAAPYVAAYIVTLSAGGALILVPAAL
ncbi:hypothetical protein F0U61_42105 [Archangium violaceum]|uniref:hypothetical protein n=1 Tax=Archangium violaceum TaxID=83451 RepID=UPI002B2C5AE7|nr:hypothetical protein F0U61_42105 [Archangium violaceum]